MNSSQPTSTEESLEQPALSTGQFGTTQYEWEATNDFNTERTKNWTAAMISFQTLFMVIALLTQQWFLLLILIAVVAVTMALSRYPSKTSLNQLTSLGIVIDGTLKKWSELKAFWVQDDGMHVVAGFESKKRFDLTTVVFIDDEDHEAIIDIIAQYLPIEEKTLSPIDLLVEAFGSYIRNALHFLLERMPLTKKK